MSPRLFLLADTSAPEALGSKLVHGATQLGVAESDLDISYINASPFWSPSMKRMRGKIFYRLADRRSWEWWGFQRKLLDQVSSKPPNILLVTGILPLAKEVFKAVKSHGGLCVNYLTDDPWNPIHRRRCFLASLQYYDHIFSTKQALQQRLHSAGVKATSWLPFAYDPELHKGPLPDPEDENRYGVDITFIGTGARERLAWLHSLSGLAGVKLRIYGNSWQGLATPGWERREALQGEAYCRAIASARVVLGLLRQSNRDLSTDRSYEIGAIGGCGIYQDSQEHRALLPDYPDVGFFSTPAQLRKNVEEILSDPDLQGRMRRLGAAALRRPEHTYAARLQTILDWARQQAGQDSIASRGVA